MLAYTSIIGKITPFVNGMIDKTIIKDSMIV
jgi:hypothetical protein